VSPSVADLATEVAALTDAVCTEVAGGDDRRLDELVRRRLELVALLAAQTSAGDAATAIRRIVAHDADLLARLHAQRTDARAALDRLRAHGVALGAYRGAPPRSPLYVERLG
jgi:hypothetical protein